MKTAMRSSTPRRLAAASLILGAAALVPATAAAGPVVQRVPAADAVAGPVLDGSGASVLIAVAPESAVQTTLLRLPFGQMAFDGPPVPLTFASGEPVQQGVDGSLALAPTATGAAYVSEDGARVSRLVRPLQAGALASTVIPGRPVALLPGATPWVLVDEGRASRRTPHRIVLTKVDSPLQFGVSPAGGVVVLGAVGLVGRIVATAFVDSTHRRTLALPRIPPAYALQERFSRMAVAGDAAYGVLGASDVDPGDDRLLQLPAKGKARLVTIERSGLEGVQACAGPSSDGLIVHAIGSSPDGGLAAVLSCGNRFGREASTTASWIAGITATGRIRWSTTISALEPGVRTAPPATLADGRLAFLAGDALNVVAVPGAKAPARGKVVSTRIRSGAAVVRISCVRPIGTVCSGTAVVRRGGAVVGQLPYAVPAGTKAMEPEVERTLALPAGTGALKTALMPFSS